MKWPLFAVLLLGATGCESEDNPTIALEEILPQSERYKEGEPSIGVEEEVLVSKEDQMLALIQEVEMEADAVIFLEDRIFPERFGSKSVERFQVKGKTEGMEETFYCLIFDDSLKTVNAFYNWMDCFGEDCRSFTVGEEVRWQQKAFTIWVGDTSLVFVESTERQITKAWKDLLKLRELEEAWNYSIEQRRNGKAQWFTFENKKKQLLKNQ